MLRWRMTEVAPGLYRSPQPAHRHLHRIKQAGIKTVLNLRGLHPYRGQDEWRAACAEAGLAYVEVPSLSRGAPQAWMIEALLKAYEEAAFPALIHCKAGADRTGFAAALYQHYFLDRPIEEAAREQLSLRFGHFKIGKTGVLDFFFEAYAAQAGDLSFDEWWRSYDHEALQQDFDNSGRGSLRLDLLLRRE